MGLIERSFSLGLGGRQNDGEEQEVDFSTIVAYLDALLRVGPWRKHPRRLRLQAITMLIRSGDKDETLMY